MPSVQHRALSWVASSALACVACSGHVTGEQTQALSATDAPLAEAVCPDRDTEVPRVPREPRWLLPYAGPEITSVAASADGGAVLASGAETLKLGADGTEGWSLPYGALVASDGQDNVYIAGSSNGLSAAATESLGLAEGELFVAKVDAAGRLLQTVSLPAPPNAQLTSLALAPSGNLAVSGAGLGTAELDNSGAILFQIESAGQVAFDAHGNLLLSRSGAQIGLSKLGPDGTTLWSKDFGPGSELQRVDALAVDAQDNVIVAGTFERSIDLGGGALSAPTDACPEDAWCRSFGFVAKLDPQGAPLFSVSRGPVRSLSSVVADSRGRIALSETLPGGVRPFRRVSLTLLDAQGVELWQRAEWPDTGIGAGRSLSVGPCDELIWSLDARASLTDDGESAFVAKL